MRAVVVPEPGGPEALQIVEVADPTAGPGEVVIDIAASAVNRADIMQRQGNYPPPPGASDILGLECSGTIASVGEGVERWSPGDEVCALLSGGGYADQVVVSAGQVLPIPAGVDLVHAAALPEVASTVWCNVFMLAALQPGEAFLVHGGGSGIGTMAIQLAKALGAQVACTVGSAAKAEACLRLGADLAINYHDEDFVSEVRRLDDDGVDVILDNMGASYLERNIDALATEGRLVIIGFQGGTRATLDLSALMRKRAAIISTGLRARPVAEKSAIIASVEANVWPLVADGQVKPVVHSTVALSQVREAHELVEASSHIGKVVLTT